MLKRLRIRFICINMIIVTLMLGILLGTILHFTKQNIEQQSINMIHTIAANPVRSNSPSDPLNGIRLPYFTVQLGTNGELIDTYGGFYNLDDQAFLQTVISTALSSEDQLGTIAEYHLRYCRMATPSGQYLVFVDTSYELKTIETLVRNCILCGGIAFLAFFFMSVLLARWAIAPVEKAWAQQRQFVADASHELKTPLTVIMTNAELLQHPGYDDQAKEQFAGNIVTESHQMRGLVESMLELARADSDKSKLPFAQVDFSQIVSDAILPFEPVFFEKGLVLQSEMEEGIQLWGSQSYLQQLPAILLDNAQKYSSPGGTTTLTLKRQKRNRCLLTVSNPGDPLSPDEVKDIFKRFYRVDQARSMNHSYGLGLAIAQSIVQMHSGKIWAESTAEGDNIFYISLPLSRKPYSA